LEVVADLHAGRPLVEPSVRSGLVEQILAENPRVDAIVCRGLVDAHETVCVVPVTTRAVSPIDHHDIAVALSDERIRERHPGRTRTNDQIVGIDHGHDPAPSLGLHDPSLVSLLRHCCAVLVPRSSAFHFTARARWARSARRAHRGASADMIRSKASITGAAVAHRALKK
jgi:hypothetical protein